MTNNTARDKRILRNIHAVAALPGAPLTMIASWMRVTEPVARTRMLRLHQAGYAQPLVAPMTPDGNHQSAWYATPKGIAAMLSLTDQTALARQLTRRGMDPDRIVAWTRQASRWPIFERLIISSREAGWRISAHQFAMLPEWGVSNCDLMLIGSFGDHRWREIGIVLDLPWTTDRWIADKSAWLREYMRQRPAMAAVVVAVSETRGRQWLRWMQEQGGTLPGGVIVLPKTSSDLWPGGTLGISHSAPPAESYWDWNGALANWGTYWRMAKEQRRIAPYREPVASLERKDRNWAEMSSWDAVLASKRSKSLVEQLERSRWAWMYLRLRALTGQDDCQFFASLAGTYPTVCYRGRQEVAHLVTDSGWTALGKRTMSWMFPTFPLTENRRSASLTHDRELLRFLVWVQQCEGGALEWYPFYQDQGVSYTPAYTAPLLRPDAIGIRHHRYMLERWYVEYDRGTEASQRWEEKLTKYDAVLSERLASQVYQRRIWCIVAQPGDGQRLWKVINETAQRWARTTTIVLEWEQSTGHVGEVFLARYRASMQGHEALWRDWLKNGDDAILSSG